MAKRPLMSAFVVALILVLVGLVVTLATGPFQGRPFWNAKAPDMFAEGKVGVVSVLGAIVDSGPVLEDLRAFRDDDNIKAILLRVDSPGGGVGASQEIYREIKRATEVKPVVCSMGGVAASGGYYIASACTHIVANPGTITGSIGVIMAWTNLEELFKKIGVRMEVIKAGSLKGAGMPDRPLTEGERRMLQDLINQAHAQFMEDVANGRDIPLETIKPLATGEVFTGQKALELGLVDELGNYYDAVEKAGALGGIQGEVNTVFPQDERHWLRQLLDDASSTFLRRAQTLLPGGLQYVWQPPQVR